MKTTFITTVKNEEKTVASFLHSLFRQSVLPDEIIIVDGGSEDKTLSKISNFKFPPAIAYAKHWRAGQISNKKKLPKVQLFVQKGNRAQGRNYAIAKATGSIILCSDAGCILDKRWVEKIIRPFGRKTVGVAAGFYRGESKTVFQECIVPFILVMPDKLYEETFLPSARSMAFRKSVWKKIGTFPENYGQNEDFVFAKKLKKENIRIAVVKDAIVYWIPPNTIYKSFRMLFRHAFGDAEAALLRPKVLLVFLRYTTALFLLFFFIKTQNYTVLYTLYALIFIYLIYAVIKNYRYVNAWQAIAILPLLQITADIAVITGTVIGLIRRLFQ